MRVRVPIAVAAVLLTAAVSGPPAHAATRAAVARRGCSTVATSDADGDGRSDALVPVPGKASGTGEVIEMDGSPEGVVGVRAFAQGHGGLPAARGTAAQFGKDVATGDITGDGCADAAVSAPADTAASAVANLSEHGSVTILYGERGEGWTTTGSQLITAATLHLPAPTLATAGAPVVRTLSEPVLGDFDGDGHDDLVMVERSELRTTPGTTSVHLVVVPGSSSGLLLDRAEEVTAPSLQTGGGGTFEGHEVLLAAGSVSGGRFDDLAVAIGGANVRNGRPEHGNVSEHPVVDVLYGGSGGLESGRATQIWDRERGGVPGTDSRSGTHDDSARVAVTFGDFDGDGRADLAYSLPLQNTVIVLRGRSAGLGSAGVQVLQRGTGGLLGTAPKQQDVFGSALAAGDFNADGDDELVVGSSDASISVVPGTHASGLTGTGDLLWDQATSGIPGAKEALSGFGARLTTGSYGRGSGEDLLVADPSYRVSTGSVTELFGGRTRNVGLVKTNATVITESTPGVPGAAVEYDEFGGLQRTGGQ